MTISSRAMGVTEMPDTNPQQALGRIVTDAQIGAALDYLRDNAAEIGAARARLIKAGHMVKHVEALLMLASDLKSVESRKADAKCSDRWMAAVNEESEAAGEFEKMKALREAASAKIEAWRSESANYRGMRV
tara:strand:- start:70 stop:465 length:396 start_codon:yes stop_codon:yes gene_type:complete